MGLLTEGTPLSWPESEPYRERVKRDGIEQFLHIFHAAKDFRNHDLKWGDEVEYLLVKMDKKKKKATLSLRGPELLDVLQRDEHSRPAGSSVPVLWRPEYARWMIEGTPGLPYRCYAADLANVELNMALRRSEIAKLLRPSETVLSITSFPRMGCDIYTTPLTVPFGEVARSFFTSDDVISPHPRFPTLTKNIRLRRGEKVRMEVPLFIDYKTCRGQSVLPKLPFDYGLLDHAKSNFDKAEDLHSPDFDLIEEGYDDYVEEKIVLDSTAFGMGSACLQVTVQGRDLSESRYLYDQMAVMAPLMLALTAATPVWRGQLADTDVRWSVISGAMDDRSPEELEAGVITKSRYSSIDCFLSSRDSFKPEEYNDVPVAINEDAYKRLREGGVDHMLAQHVAHLFIRDPLVIYKEKVDQDNATSTDHFENIQSTNWNTVRLKPPPPGTDIGWRTEFRSMEVGLTDFENAAFSVFMVLLSRVIFAFNLNFYIPISKVDANMETAHKRDAVRKEAFFFRKNVFKASDGSGFMCECGHIHNASLVGGHAKCVDINKFCARSQGGDSSDSDSDPFDLMTLDEIFNGRPMCWNGRAAGFEFPGLIPLMRGYLDALEIDAPTRQRLLTYLDFIAERAAGTLMTNATYMRDFISRHGQYRSDSIVSDRVCYDLMQTLDGISKGDDNYQSRALLGRFQAEGIYTHTETADTMMERMQKIFEGPEGALLYGSSMPRSALEETVKSIALESKSIRRCKSC